MSTKEISSVQQSYTTMGIENLGLKLDYQDIANFGPNMSISIMLFYVNAIYIRELLLVIFSKREEKKQELPRSAEYFFDEYSSMIIF